MGVFASKGNKSADFAKTRRIIIDLNIIRNFIVHTKSVGSRFCYYTVMGFLKPLPLFSLKVFCPKRSDSQELSFLASSESRQAGRLFHSQSWPVTAMDHS